MMDVFTSPPNGCSVLVNEELLFKHHNCLCYFAAKEKSFPIPLFLLHVANPISLLVSFYKHNITKCLLRLRF